jgi:tetratricopeptide (TPR) repeat protein
MTYDDQLEDRKREYNKEVERRQYLRQDAESNQKQLDANRAQARRYFNQGDMYLGIYRLAGPDAANAYAAQMRKNQEFLASAVNDYFNSAIAEMDNKNYTNAIAHVSKAITLTPNEFILPYMRGNCYYRLSNYREAERDYSQAVALNPNFGFLRLQRGICRVLLSDLDGAIGDLDAAQGLLQHEQWSTITWTSYGAQQANVYYWRGRARYWRGRARYHNDDLSNAIADLSIAIQTRPDWADPYYLRAAAYSRMEAHELAIADWTSILKREPTATAFRERAYLYRKSGDDTAELADWDEVIRRDATPADYTFRGWCRLNSRRLDDDALLDFETAIGRGDHTAFAYLGRAHVHRDRGDTAEAMDDYTTVIGMEPDDRSAYISRARLHFDVGEYRAALADFDQSIRIDPTKAFSYAERGDCHTKMGNRVAAKEDFLAAASLYFKQDMPEKAKEVYAQAFPNWTKRP